MDFPRGGFYSSITEAGNTIVLAKPINPFDSWIQASRTFNKLQFWRTQSTADVSSSYLNKIRTDPLKTCINELKNIPISIHQRIYDIAFRGPCFIIAKIHPTEDKLFLCFMG
jgi:hypothetical protein